MIYPENLEQKIGFDRIRQQLDSLCLSNMGKDKVVDMHFSTNYSFLQREIIQVSEFRQMLMMEDNFPVQFFFDLTSVLKKIRIEGTFPEPEEVFNMKRSLDTVKSIVSYLKDRAEKYPTLLDLTKDVKFFPLISDYIDKILNNQGRIKDNASAELHNIRKQIHSKESEISKRIQQILKHARSEGWTDDDASPAIRDGRLVIPVLANHKRRIKGFILDESSTGKTSFIEPAEVVELNNDIKELEYAERYEIVKILSAFADFVRPYIDELLPAYYFLGEIDFIRARALYANDINAVCPPFFENSRMSWLGATHPLLYQHLRKEKREVVPLDINLNERERILVISGPNAGGKSVCLQTVCLLQYMLQCGLLIPVRETSECGIFEHIFIDIGDEQSIENDLSTYSSHLQNMKFFLRNANERTLFLIDEFGTGTEPNIGGAIAESILQELNYKFSLGVVTTHFTNLKHYASNTEGVINGAMLFDTHNLAPVFKLVIGEPGSSFAFEIARKIGLPEIILQEATKKVGKDQINYDKHLKDIIRDKHYWERKRFQVKEKDKKLETVLEQYTAELEKANKERKEILAKAKADAQQLLAGVNKQIENTIHAIKEAQAEKERTKEVRKQIDVVKKQVETFDNTEDEHILRKIEKLKQREEQRSKNSDQTKNIPKEQAAPEKDLEIRKGDKVKLFGSDNVGEVLDKNDKSVMVAFGQMVTTLSENRLEKISNNEFKRLTKHPIQASTSYSTSEKRLNFKLQLDLRGQRADDALQAVTEYIDQAIMLSISEVKILHGKGNGILRKLIREYLKTIDLVEWYGDESVEFGGAGITVVKFS